MLISLGSRQFWEVVYKMFDQDHDNKINFKEYLVALTTITKGTIEEKLRSNFLFFLEFSFFFGIHYFLLVVFSIYDKDGNGFLSRNEIFEVVHVQSRLTDQFFGSKIETEESILEISDGLYTTLKVSFWVPVTAYLFCLVFRRNETIGGSFV